MSAWAVEISVGLGFLLFVGVCLVMAVVDVRTRSRRAREAERAALRDTIARNRLQRALDAQAPVKERLLCGRAHTDASGLWWWCTRGPGHDGQCSPQSDPWH